MKLHMLNATRLTRARLVRVVLLLALLPVLLAPLAGSAQAAAPAAPEAKKGDGCRWVHIYARGEPLSVVARWYGITARQLRDANPQLNRRKARDGEALCIPGVRIIYDAPDVRYNANVFLNRVTVWGDYLPKWHTYAVRVRADRSSAWIRVGSFRPARDGSFEAHFRLPRELREARYYEVCLKDLEWGFSLCDRVDLRYTPRPRTACGPLFARRQIPD